MNQLFGLGRSELLTLQVNPTPDLPLGIPMVIEGQPTTLEMYPHSVRSPIYQLRAQLADGSIVPVDPGPERTLRGSLIGQPESRAAGSLLDDGLHALIINPMGERFWLEPVRMRLPSANADQYVLYRSFDVINQGGTCGVTEEWMKQHPPTEPEGLPEEGGIAGSTLFCVDLGVDADFEYFVAHGSNVASVQSQINLVINTVNLQYEAEVDIRHVITTILVRTAEQDPYNTTAPGSLLNQFANEWNTNQTAIVHDVAHLFTGKNLDGTVIGIASLGVVCTASGYSLVQSDCCGGLSCQSDLSAHELGHNWSAQHCSCPGNTMNPSITCANVHAAASITQIINHRNTRTCIVGCEDNYTSLPFNDDFPSTTIDISKWSGNNGALSNTTGTSEPSAPNSLNLDGSTLAGDQLRSAKIDASALGLFTLSFQYQRRGGGDSPETGDDLVVEYQNAAATWVEINRQLGSGADMVTYSPVTLNLPLGAFHDALRIRFRCISAEVGADDWFVDNVNMTGAIAPVNNSCTDGTIVPVGSYAIDNSAASTDGPDEPATCNFNGSTQVTNDVWFRFVAQCTGTATASLCGATFDAKMAIYSSACPAGPSTALFCADNTCGNDPEISFPVTSGTVHRIRVGGFNGSTGTGTLVLTCVPSAPPCVADITGNQVVNVDDLLAVINAWGPCPNPNSCPSDISPAGGDDVVNVDDLLAVINGWGNCPP